MGVQLAEEQQGFSDTGDDNLEASYYVRDVLKSVRLGESEGYHELIRVLYHTECLKSEDVAYLVSCLKALSGAVSYIDSDHHQYLLSSISGMSFWNYGPDVMDVWVELIVSLAAVSGKYLYICLDMLVRNFMPPISFLNLLKQRHGLAKKEQVLYRAHSALKEIADLVPLAPLTLEQTIKNRMPYKNSKQPWILSVLYVENMLRLEGGAISELVGRSMLVEVINRIVELDVELGWDELLVDDSSKGMFEMDLEEPEMPAVAERGDIQTFKESSNQKILSSNEVVGHLDLLMVFTFEHLKACYESGRLGQVFEVLLLSFQSTVLHAYKSKFSQFVMFYACSLDPENCGERFADRLFDIFKNSAYVPEWRMGAVAYLASYLSRARFLSASYVMAVLESLVDWCCTYGKNQEGETNSKAHSLLFRNPEAILKHSLNPLKVCLPLIVHEFMQQAKAARLFSVEEEVLFYGVRESEDSRAFGGLERLDMFFPFDPYLLQNSDRFIRPNFIYWSMVRTDDNEDDYQSEASIDEDLDEDSGINVRDDTMAMSFDAAALNEFDDSLSKMSITPRNYRFGSELQSRKQMPSRIRPSTCPESL